MKNIIRKVEYITGDSRSVFNETIKTDNIEHTRKELHALVKCDRTIFVYDSIEK